MQWAVWTFLVELSVLPAASVSARHLLLWSDILAKEELLLRHELEADRILQVEEAYLQVFVEVEPVEDFHHDLFLGCKAPTLDDLLELFESNVAFVMPVQLIEGLLQ